MLKVNKIKIIRKIVEKIKINRIINQQIRESYGNQPIEWVARRREWNEHVIRIDAERLVKI